MCGSEDEVVETPSGQPLQLGLDRVAAAQRSQSRGRRLGYCRECISGDAVLVHIAKPKLNIQVFVRVVDRPLDVHPSPVWTALSRAPGQCGVQFGCDVLHCDRVARHLVLGLAPQSQCRDLRHLAAQGRHRQNVVWSDSLYPCPRPHTQCLVV